ncbi:MAG: WecB/TagA/CpsF family glycosyltransferase [Opitutaceae bacterium]|nr:WecB/TagA/CpsF family glycosyltransferase [Opitutaceae bacterium]
MNSAPAPFVGDALASREAPPRAVETISPTLATWPVAILGVPFDHVTIAGAVASIEAMIASRHSNYIVTANVDFLVQAHRDVELRRILLDADLVLCDGTPLVWASGWMGNRLPERVAGSDLAPALLHAAAEKGHRIFFLGAAPGVAAAAAERLQCDYPTLNVVGHYAPPFADLLDMDHAQIVQRVREAKPDILLVSFGCPKQEKWIAMNHRTLGVPVAIGVGATIDFLAGRVKRAPDWMRRSGTEWIFRLGQEPRRLFRRYATDLLSFIPTLAAQWCRLFSRPTVAPKPRTMSFPTAEWCGVDPGESFTRHALDMHPEFWRELPHRAAHCVVDLSKLRRIDGTGVAFLVRWRKILQANGRQLVLLAPSSRLRRALSSLGLLDHFVVANDVADAAQQAEAIAAQPSVLRDGTTRSLAWCGEIIAANAEDVWRMTTDHVRAFVDAGATLVIIDLARLRFVDSSGAALMLRLKKWAQSLPAQVLFTHAQPNVRNVLRLTRLDQLLLEGAQ